MKSDYPSENPKERVIQRAMKARALNPEPPNLIQSQRIVNSLREEVLGYVAVAVRRIRQETEVFPPVHVVRDQKLKTRLRIRLGKSAERGLYDDLVIVVDLTILDAAGAVIELIGNAFCGSSDPPDAPPAATEIFSGVYNSANQAPVYDAFESYMYQVIDIAQVKTAERASSSAADPIWLMQV